MGFRIATGVIPRGQMLPEGPWTLEIVKIEETRTDDNLRQVTMERRTVWPSRGLPDYEYYTLGTPEDPDAEETATQVSSIGMQMLMKCLDLAGVRGLDNPDADSDQLFKNAEGCRFDAQCTYVTDDGTKNPTDKGRVYKRLMMYKAGALAALRRPPAKPEPPPSRPQPPTPAPAPTNEDEDATDRGYDETVTPRSGRPGLSATTKSAPRPGPSYPPSRRGAR